MSRIVKAMSLGGVTLIGRSQSGACLLDATEHFKLA
jgi:hypothetical protein